MPQVSRPLLIALIAVVGFAGAWMTVLRKHVGQNAGATATEHVATAPGTGGLGRAVQRAHGAVAASAASAVKAEAAAGQAPAVKAAAPKPAPAKVVARPVKPNVVKVPAATTTVLLFSGSGADDAAARAVVRSIHVPHVRTIVAPLTQVTRYAPLLGGLPVTAAPAIFVIGADRSAQQIVGLPDPDQIKAAIAAVSAGR